MNVRKFASFIVLSLVFIPAGSAQDRPEGPGRRDGPPGPEVTVDWSEVEQRIAWFGTLDTALSAAKKTKRPILLVSGAPSCSTVPGVW
jgi:hypothetical protein